MDDIDPLTAMATMRSIRRYRPEPVPDDDLATILFAATRAPSGSNRQPFRFVVLRDDQRSERARAVLGRSFRDQWAAKQAADGWAEGSGDDPTSRKGRARAAMQAFVDGFESIPVVILVCFQRDRVPGVHDGASVFPACQNLLLAARTLGYGGCLTMWHAPVVDEVMEILAVPADVHVLATITLGRPVGGHGPVRRRPLRDVVFEGAWGRAPAWAVDPPDAVLSRSRPRGR
jgi:nitroreductase